MNLTEKISTHNFRSFLWHAGFLALAQNFMDVDTVIPAMLVEAGGNAIHIGIITAIMLGGSSFTQLFFAPFISNFSFKKPIILTGINARILSLIALGAILFYLKFDHSKHILPFIFLFITIFSVSGSFANIGYVDIVGKTIREHKRKKFFSSRQIISGFTVLISAYLAKEIISFKAFPINYAYSFLIGGALLLIASLGFWNVKEQEPSQFKIGSVRHFYDVLRNELKQNKKLLYFLGFINMQGIAISFLPFVVLYAKQTFHSQSTDTGYFLLFKIMGVVIVSFLVLLFSSRTKYNVLLYFNVFLSILLALFVFYISELETLRYVFVFGGIIYSLFNITMNGVLLEISGTGNRALYTGFAGAGNILPAIFPLIGGALINQFGYTYFFVFFIVIVSSTTFFIRKLNCGK